MAIPELKVGDIILVGKWKNRRATIKSFSKDSNNQPTVHTDKGEFPIFHFRVEKLMGESMNKAQELLQLCEADDGNKKQIANLKKQLDQIRSQKSAIQGKYHDQGDEKEKEWINKSTPQAKAYADKWHQLDAQSKKLYQQLQGLQKK